ncbi:MULTISPECIES: type IV secretion system protein VirB10 [unclassified Bosea (in: a-proteobacteria)]|uniref:type IV secretion system protein VirB10 n=1 Tax=unclassified Bosea (in: a-proteobacteria) TaxID=2653178 RepID=UPI000F7584F2|nr:MULTISPECIES: type IV secretion system protein VirB10 [unclassified Bosea (in: a-proteobacteria)]AZO82080.1 conjugal transfer protein [Bosea sp. Tri-49]RXT24656.1 conjugal transfer protein [Bosea sp. Tri-39]RXT42491.1 conjugal transfer protein [Bosea sp. Tri-54]
MPSADDYRAFELEAAAATSVARGRTVLGRLLTVGIPAGALVVAGWLLYRTTNQRPTIMTTPDKEEFTTTQFPAPSLSTPRPQTDQGTIVIPQAPVEPPAPPPPPPQTIQPPPAPEPPLPTAAANDDEARRLAEFERQRLAEEERRKWERLRAPQVISDNSATAAGAGNLESSSGTATAADDDPNRRFLASVSAAGVDISRATRNNRIDALVAQGTLIRGVLETAVQSDLPGMVRAVVTENVWSYDGRRILIPAGSRLVGEYKSGLTRGQTRVFVVWTRLLRSDGVSIQLGSNGTDDLGRAGSAGTVDNHYLERFGAAIMLSLVGGAAQFLSGFGQNYDSTGNGTVVTTTDPVTGAVTQTQTGVGQNQLSLQARQIAAQNVSQTLTNIAQEALKNSINIPPTIHLDQGIRIIVFVRRDLDFSSLYPDPVKEALRELRRERTIQKPHGLP